MSKLKLGDRVKLSGESTVSLRNLEGKYGKIVPPFIPGMAEITVILDEGGIYFVTPEQCKKLKPKVRKPTLQIWRCTATHSRFRRLIRRGEIQIVSANAPAVYPEYWEKISLKDII